MTARDGEPKGSGLELKERAQSFALVLGPNRVSTKMRALELGARIGRPQTRRAPELGPSPRSGLLS